MDDVFQPARFAGGWPAWPAYALVDDLLPTLETWAASGHRIALATLVEVVGSSPRPVGSEMAIADDGRCVGYVSGGCVEAAVVQQALELFRDGKPRMLEYGAGSPFLDVQLSCGGRIRIFVRELREARHYIETRRSARDERRDVHVINRLEDGGLRFADAMDDHESLTEFRQIYSPPIRLVLVGGDPIVMALLRLAPMLAIETVLLRPRGPEALPDSEPTPSIYDRRALDLALAGLQLDARSAVYTLSHDADTDHEVLRWALRSKAFSVGALGSRRKAAMRRERLAGEGFDDSDLARLRSPAGLDIGARTPFEIALSILSEIIAARGA
jgi:xanthine dehydrogenase accessory factor